MQFIDLHRQYDQIDKKVKEGILDVLDHKRFIMGQEIKDLEARLAEYVGVKHAICCASGTDALIIPLMAYGIEKTDAIFVPSFTFFASAESVSIAGGTPVFVDCDKDTFNMSVESLKKSIEHVKKEGKLNLKGIVAVDLFGLPADFEAIREVADEYGLFILEDGAQGFGGCIGEKRACSFGDVASTSFFPAKPLGCYGDGGAIFTNDDEMAAKINSIHIHGQGTDKYDNIRLGLNSRLDTMQAVVLDAKLDIFEQELVMRNKVAQMYTEALKDVLDTPVVPEGCFSSWAQYTLKVREGQYREDIIEKLKRQGVPTAVYYPIPIHQSTAYADIIDEHIELPITESIANKVFSIPMHPYLEEDEIKYVCDAIKNSIE
ncbi:MAG: DegT/DnrJ/EryC1/StrS aminotransferase family protein [Bacillota bacterium]|nr:DegT/DnrJ/EryC1/StrS aminotransferase family protein [Bacillota bacterium]